MEIRIKVDFYDGDSLCSIVASKDSDKALFIVEEDSNTHKIPFDFADFYDAIEYVRRWKYDMG